MKQILTRKIVASILFVSMTILSPLVARAELADLADVPLANAPSDAVLPNLMYILDDSGSMTEDWMPENVGASNNCKSCTSRNASSCNTGTNYCRYDADAIYDNAGGEPPYFANEFNQIYYNPDLTYDAALTATGLSMGNQPAGSAKNDGFGVMYSGTKNLLTNFPDIYYCNTNSPASLSNTTLCRRNGIDNVQSGLNNYFLYNSNNATTGTPLGGYPVATGTTSTSFIFAVLDTGGHPFYYTISPHEYCSDANLVNCALANANGSAPSGFSFPAPVRYCALPANTALTTAVSDAANSTSPKCRKKFDGTNYAYPRFGRFRRVDIVSTTTTYPMRSTARRTDCANATYCTYAEEIQNFANWYSYYRIRMFMMKTASGRAFLSIDDRYRVGFITINPNNPVTSSKYLPMATFDATQKSAFYSKLYAQTDNGSTPLREALARVGRHYAGVTTGINSGMPQDPMQYSCQQNFALLTSDGYWNENDSRAIKINNSQVGNQDNVADTANPFFVSRASGTLDGIGTTFTNVQPTTIVEQSLCTGTATTTFTTGTQTSCGCAAGQKRIKQRTVIQTTTVSGTDDVQQTSNTSTGTASFQDITSCDSNVSTAVTPVTETAQYVCSNNNNTAFAAAANGNNSQQACGCTTGRTATKQRVVTYNKTVVTTDGVAAAPTYSAGSASITTPVACSTAAKTAAATTTSNGTTTTTNNGGTTHTTADIILNPNPSVTPGSVTATNVPGGTPNTLADVAMYYYKTDLRTSGAIATDNVPTSAKDITPQQHMVTFTLGLGLTGLMDYLPNYETSSTGDFAKIRSGSSGCSWTTGTCNWPTPTSGSNTTLDDLWHAAVNGRGTYYSASDPNTLADGLSSALAALKIQTAAASASATSTPNITQSDNFAYSSTFRTVKWDGEIVAQRIDPTNGNVLPTIIWSAQSLLDAKVAPASDTRTIYTFSAAAGNKLKTFVWGNLTSGEQAIFANQCPAFSQCTTLGTTDKALANDGQNLVNYLRGQSQYAGTLYRARDHTLGDSVNAAPIFVRAPRFSFNDAVTPTYGTFKAANATRQGVLYVATNDGMLHAFNGDTGQELWAYVPRIIFPLMPGLASDNWDVRHQFIVDGSPQVMEVFDSSASAWKTILIAGLNKGGRGYYALDITDPANPKALWEACSDSSVCAVSDNDFGYSFGYPVVAKRPTDGRWVALVTSGVNNVTPGTGRGYLFVLDALTGAILQKIDTGAGDTTTPSGFSRISGYANNFNLDNTVTFVYGGDLLGNLWRFDMSTATPTILKLATLKDGTGKPQSITTRPELTIISGSRVVYVGTGRYLGPDDLSDPATLSPPLPWAYQQSLYAIKDRSIALGNVRTSSPGLVQQTLTTTSLTTRSTSSLAVDWTGKDGWYVDFNPGNVSPGERVNIDPQLVQGALIVATAVPSNTVCAVGGDSWFYQFDYKAGTFIASAAGSVVGQKFTGKTIVGVVVIVLPDGTLKAVTTDSGGGKNTLGVTPPGSGGVGKRVSWRELIQ